MTLSFRKLVNAFTLGALVFATLPKFLELHSVLGTATTIVFISILTLKILQRQT